MKLYHQLPTQVKSQVAQYVFDHFINGYPPDNRYEKLRDSLKELKGFEYFSKDELEYFLVNLISECENVFKMVEGLEVLGAHYIQPVLRENLPERMS